jgi:hypothetical protein
VADRIDRGVNGRSVVRPEADDAAAEESAFEDLRVQRTLAFKHHPGARFQFLPRVNQRLPESGGRSGDGGASVPTPSLLCPQSADEQALHGAAAGHTTPDETRRKHPCVVDDDDIAGLQQLGKLADCRMRDRPGRSFEVQQSRGAALGGRFLRDQVGGKIEVEVADVHPRLMLAAIGYGSRLSAVSCRSEPWLRAESRQLKANSPAL